jgi:chromosomal replication initiation ATPase DnaA
MTSDFPDNNEINRWIKQWKGEIKKQEQTITSTRCNALNLDQQLGVQGAPEMEQRQDMLEIMSESPPFVNVEYNQALCLPTETLAMATIANASKQSASDVITETGTNFKLNEAQLKAFQIITSHFIASYVDNEVDAEPVKHLVMLLTGPGGTGKTHIVKAVQAVMRHYRCANLIRFLAPTRLAAALIDGMTVHKGLGLKIKSLNKGKGNRQPGCTT